MTNCFGPSFINAEPQPDTFCGCHEDYPMDWQDETDGCGDCSQQEDCPCNPSCSCRQQKPKPVVTQTQTTEPTELEYEIVEI